jgi:hypothetical protein
LLKTVAQGLTLRLFFRHRRVPINAAFESPQLFAEAAGKGSTMQRCCRS